MSYTAACFVLQTPIGMIRFCINPDPYSVALLDIESIIAVSSQAIKEVLVFYFTNFRAAIIQPSDYTNIETIRQTALKNIQNYLESKDLNVAYK